MTSRFRRPGRLHRRRGDDGFVLLETLVTISLISLVMAAFTTFFVNAVASTNLQRSMQAATQIADSAVETIRALPSSDVVKGRDTATVAAQFGAAPSTVVPSLASMTPAVDPTAASGSGLTAAIPTVPTTQTINNVQYSINDYVGNCSVPLTATTNANCTSGVGISYLRAVVAVTWTGAHCPQTRCQYITATLLSPTDDPLFNLNQVPPAAPVITNPGTQTWAVLDTVSLPLAVIAVPTYTVAITSGMLPAGLSLTPATGLISGTPSAVTAASSVTLTVTDGFGRSASTTVNFVVLPNLVATQPGNQSGVLGNPITPLVISATGGNPSYTWSDPGSTLPPGLSLTTVNNQASISGTPNAVGSQYPLGYPVSLTVRDSQGRIATVTFSWYIGYPPFAAATPADQISTVGVAASLSLSVTGGSGAFTWTSTQPLPAGLTLTPGGVLSGTPTTAGVTSVALTVTDNNSYASLNPNVKANQNITFK